MWIIPYLVNPLLLVFLFFLLGGTYGTLWGGLGCVWASNAEPDSELWEIIPQSVGF